MGFNLRKSGTVPDGSITTAKIADGAITADKIADNAVETNKIKNQAVTTAKAVEALARHIYLGDETEVSVTGTTMTSVKEFSLAVKDTPVMDWQKMHIQSLIKSNDAAHTTTLSVYIDAEPTPRITLTTTSTAYVLESGSCDISDLSKEKHLISIKMKSSNAAGIAYNELLDVFTEL